MARTFELDVVPHAISSDELAEQDRSSIAQLRIPAAELVAGVDHGDRLGPIGHAIAGDHLDSSIRLEPIRVDTQVSGQLMVHTNQARR